ncbi:MAG: hypothetical protein ACYC2U_07990 [Candidatus Amoebophilus sp.]
MATKTQKDYQKDYTKPHLREELKEQIKQGDKGGKPGQWSARKSQLLVKEYEAHGGGYKHSNELTSSQKNLQQWTEEDWKTVDNRAAIRDGETVRYLPKEVWDQLTEEEKKKTNSLKAEGSHTGKQHINNPEEVREILRRVLLSSH